MKNHGELVLVILGLDLSLHQVCVYLLESGGSVLPISLYNLLDLDREIALEISNERSSFFQLFLFKEIGVSCLHGGNALPY